MKSPPWKDLKPDQDGAPIDIPLASFRTRRCAVHFWPSLTGTNGSGWGRGCGCWWWWEGGKGLCKLAQWCTGGMKLEDATIFGTHPLLPSPAAAELFYCRSCRCRGLLGTLGWWQWGVKFLFIDYSPHLEVLRNRLGLYPVQRGEK